MKKIALLFGSLVITLSLYSQDFSYDWSTIAFDSIYPNGVLVDSIGDKADPMDEYPRGLVVDKMGNVITIGYMFGSVWDISGAPIKVYETNGMVAFIQKRDADGHLLWAHYFDSKPNLSGSRQIRDIALDADDNIYVCGNFQDSTDFDPGPGEAWAYPTGGTYSNGFIAKYNPNGDLEFLHFQEADHNNDFRAVSIDVNGNIFVSGIFSNSIDFDAGPGVSMGYSNGQDDDFVLKLDSDGDYLWHKTWGNSGENDVVAMETDNFGNVFISGLFHNTVDFDPGDSTTNLTSAGQADVYILKLDSNGIFQWVNHLKSQHPTSIFDMACDGENVGVVVNFQYWMELGPANPIMVTDSTSWENLIAVKLDQDGNYLWHYTPEPIDSPTFMSGNSLAVQNGEWFVGLSFYSNTTIDLDNGVTIDSIHHPFNAVAIVKLNDDGVYQWNKTFPLDDNGLIYLDGIAVDDHALYLSGAYDEAQFDMDPDPLNQDFLPQDYSLNHYVCKLEGCRSYSDLNISECNEYVSPSGNHTWTTSGTYRDIISNTTGCDSVIAVDLTIAQSPKVNVEVSDCELYVSPSGHVWDTTGTYYDTLSTVLGCDSILIIDLDIKHAFHDLITTSTCHLYTSPAGQVLTSSGIYYDTLAAATGCDSIITIDLKILPDGVAVIDTTIIAGDSMVVGSSVYTLAGNYIDTLTTVDGCDSVIITKLVVNNATWIADVSSGNEIQLYPNPTSGQLFFESTGDIAWVKIYNAVGSVVQSFETHGTKTSINTTGLDAGIYFVEVRGDDDSVIRRKVVKD